MSELDLKKKDVNFDFQHVKRLGNEQTQSVRTWNYNTNVNYITHITMIRSYYNSMVRNTLEIIF